jgi:alcohol dehydrogenase class IV
MAQFLVPRHIFTGRNALAESMPALRECGKRALLVTGPHIGKSPMMDTLKKNLELAGISSVVFDRVTGEPTLCMITDGAAAFRQGSCDFVIGIGGGSPLDAAKAISYMCVSTGKLTDYRGQVPEKEIPPIAAIPTTAGTGSEVTKFTIITDEEQNIKMLMKGDCLIPRIAVVDPAFTVDMPKSVTAATGLDALTHAVEAYTSARAMPLTDALAISAVKRIMKYLPAAYSRGCDAKAREEMSIAALEAGICINNSSVTIVHGMSRPIGALFHVPHGLSNAMLLKECLDFAKSGASARFADLAHATGAALPGDSDEAAAARFIYQIGVILTICEIPTLREYGIGREEYEASIVKMAADAIASGSPGNTRRPVSEEDCISIYRKIYI